MAILFNINGLFAIDSTGAIEIGGAAGASTYVLMSNGAGNANSWYDVQSKFAEYLPLAGGTLTGNLAINGTNTLTVGGTLSANGGINGLTLANGGISGSNYNIAGVNQLTIADPGEGIVFTGTTTLTLAVIDDTVDDKLKLTNATQLDLNSTARITNLLDPSSAQDAATKAYVDAIGGGVSKIIASTNITISPVSGLGDVTISATDTDTTYTSGNGITFTGTPATVINADINYISYSGTNNFIVYGTQNSEGTTIPTGSQIVYADPSGTRIVNRGLVSDLPFTNNTGDLTSITLGNGLTGSSLTGPIPDILMSGSYTGTFTATSVDVVNNLTVGGDILVDNEIWLSRSNNDRNLRMTGASGTDGGFTGFSSTGANLWQLYGSGNSYGFLNSEWGQWDLEKARNSNLYMNNNTTYYLNTTSNSNFAGNLTIGSNLSVTGSAYQPASGGGYIGKPYGGDFYTTQNVYTGAIQVTLPTGGTGLDDMLKFVIDIFDYATQESVTVFVGGYTYQNVGSGNTTWYNVQAQVIGQSSAQNYTVRFGDNGTSHCVWVGDTNSSWNHLQVIVRDFFVGYGANINNWTGAWDISVVTTQTTVNNTLTNNFPMSSGDIGGPYLPLTGGTLSGNLTVNARGFFNSGGNYPLATSSTQRYNIQIRNTNNTVNSGYGWWWGTDTNFNMFFHADGASDRMTLTRLGELGVNFTAPGGYGQLTVNGTSALPILALRSGSGKVRQTFYEGGAGRFHLDSLNGSDGLAFVDGDGVTEVMRATEYKQLLINATSSGYGANNFGYNLGVRGNASQAFISIAKSTQTLDTQGMIVGVDSNTGYLIMRDNLPLDFYNNNTFKMRIATNGNVGIGTNSPSAKLEVAGNINVIAPNPYIWIGESGSGGSAGFIGWNDASDYLFLGHSYGSAFNKNIVINSSGNVGIGTTTPNRPLSIQSNSGATAISIYARSQDDYGFIQFFGYNQTTLWSEIAGRPSNLSFYQNSNEILRLGTTSYIYHNTGSTTFNANGYIYTQSWINLGGGAGIYSSTNGAHFYPNGSTYGTWRIDGSRGGYTGIYFSHGATNIGMFDSSGNGGAWSASAGWHYYYVPGNACLAIGSSTTSSTYSLYVTGAIYSTADIVAYSDRRSKENIVTIDNALDKVSKIRGVYYTPKEGDDKSRKVGVIAQELNEILPEAVTYAEDVDQYGVDYGKITGLLIEAVKELQAKVKELENK